MIQIAIVDKNRIVFEDKDMEKYLVPLLYTDHEPNVRKQIKENLDKYLWSVIEPHITFVNIEKDMLIETIAPKITEPYPDKQLNDFIYFTEGTYPSPKKYIEFIYCVPTWCSFDKSIQAQAENINSIGCLFSLKQTFIMNKCAIYAHKYDLTAEKFVVLDSLTKNDILKVIKQRYFYSAILVKDNVLKKYYYQNPAFLIKTVFGDVETIENSKYTFLNYNLSFYLKLDKSNYVNEIATRLNGMYRLYGDVLILQQDEKNMMANINLNELWNLNRLAYGRLYDRELKGPEIINIKKYGPDEKGNEVEKLETPIWSKYIVVMYRLYKMLLNDDNCINCNKQLISPVICNKCYRIKYCSDQCKLEYNDYHYDECINPKSY